MESRLRKLIAAFVISALTLSVTSAYAATSTPKPTPKPSQKTGAEVSAKGTKKPAEKKKVTKKKKKKKKLPPLQPVVCFGEKWPPRLGANEFTKEGEVFAKIPTTAELQCDSSLNSSPSKAPLRADLLECDEYACGAVTVTSENRCTWWEVTSTFERIDLRTGKVEAVLGNLRTISRGTNAQVFQSIMLVSEIKLKDADGNIQKNIKASNLAISCHHNPAPDLVKRNFFTPA
jgi:hypothetical protein